MPDRGTNHRRAPYSSDHITYQLSGLLQNQASQTQGIVFKEIFLC